MAPSTDHPYRTWVLLPLATCASLIATRWPIAPPFLFDYDNVNFALALRKFAPLSDQPHRGYPLYVGVSRIIHLLGLSPERTGEVMGVLGSAVALLLLAALARDMFGRNAAVIAPLLLFFHPTFILAGAVDHVRTFLAAGAVAVALCVWRERLHLAAFVLGIAGGFRMDLLLTMLPLLVVYPLVVQRVGWRRLVGPLGVLVLTVTPWLVFLISRSGGMATAFHYHSVMLRDNSHAFFYEGFTRKAAVMALFAAYWNGIGVLSWFWAIPAGIRRGRATDPWKHFAFLAIWFLPPFLFNAVVQVTDPDQTLASVTATCLAGAWALSALPRPYTLLGCVISAGLFLFPLVRLGREASLPWMRRVTATEAQALDGVVRTPGPRFIRIRGEFPTWRVVSYYFPEDWIEQSGKIYHANWEAIEPLPDVRSRLSIDKAGHVSLSN